MLSPTLLIAVFQLSNDSGHGHVCDTEGEREEDRGTPTNEIPLNGGSF